MSPIKTTKYVVTTFFPSPVAFGYHLSNSTKAFSPSRISGMNGVHHAIWVDAVSSLFLHNASTRSPFNLAIPSCVSSYFVPSVSSTLPLITSFFASKIWSATEITGAN